MEYVLFKIKCGKAETSFHLFKVKQISYDEPNKIE
jgi:hypothetical protein